MIDCPLVEVGECAPGWRSGLTGPGSQKLLSEIETFHIDKIEFDCNMVWQYARNQSGVSTLQGYNKHKHRYILQAIFIIIGVVISIIFLIIGLFHPETAIEVI